MYVTPLLISLKCQVYLNIYILIELSLYEVQRKPHEVITDDTIISVSPHALRPEFTCPICLDLMRNTHATKEVSIDLVFVRMYVWVIDLYLIYSVSIVSVKIV